MTRDKTDWKHALRLRNAARKAWKNDRLEREARADWQALQQCKRGQVQGWETSLAEHTPGDVHQAVHDHFSIVFNHAGDPPNLYVDRTF